MPTETGPLKVLHVITTIDRGGAENHLVQLITGQVANGIRVSVAYLKGSGYWADRFRKIGVHVTPLGLTDYSDVSPILRLRRLISQVGPDIVHGHMPPGEFYSRLALLGFGNKPVLVVSKHNDEPFYRGKWHEKLGRWSAQRASKIIAISDAVRRYVIEEVALSPAYKVVTVHYGIDPSLYGQVESATVRKVRQDWGIDDDEYLIGTVARLAPQKALHVLLEGYAQYRRCAKKRSKLVLVGIGPLEESLKKQAGQLGIDDCTVWAGFREDIPEVMNAFDLFALTSIYEGFGLVLLEAMAAARPVVASSVSAIPEIVLEAITGRLVPPNDPTTLARALEFFEESGRRNEFGDAARRRVETSFGVARMVERTSLIYGECLNGKV